MPFRIRKSRGEARTSFSREPARPCVIALGILAFHLFLVGLTQAQSGSFIIPALRGGTAADFSYWDFFQRPPGSPTNQNYNYANPPALLDGLGWDDDGNPTTAFAPRAALKQVGAPNAFITSSGAIYSFDTTTAFELDYLAPVEWAGAVTNVIFQVQTGGSRLDHDNPHLRYSVGAQTFDLAPVFRGLDDPQSGAFGERLISAFQWDLTGLNVRAFTIVFSAPGPSMPLWQAQLDATVGTPFAQELGYLLFANALPVTRHERPGSVDKNLPPGMDGRFFFANDMLELYGTPSLDWEHVGWLHNGVVHPTYELDLIFPAHDTTVTALFAPLTYAAWRELIFFHANSLTGTADDYSDDAVSGPEVDFDGDGLENWAEYAFGCDPYMPDAVRAQTQLLVVQDSGQAYPAIRYRCNGAPEGYGDVGFHVRLSTDLATWTDNRTAPTTVTVSRELQADGTVLVTERALQSVGSFNRCFMQVVAE